MVDYKDIGMRIRNARLRKGMTQEALAEFVGVGTTHISHIETGSGIASLQTFLDIANSLSCSADELLCIELTASRPQYYAWLAELLDDCTPQELKLITSMIQDLKRSLRRLKTLEDE